MQNKDLLADGSAIEQSLHKALEIYQIYSGKCKRKDYIVIVNMKEPSYRKRLYVFDTETSKIIRAHHCAHGVGSSSKENPAMCVKVSNIPGTHCSSMGAMVTTDVYKGKHGTSLRLQGLERGVNDYVASRSIVVHGAKYVSDNYIIANGYAGRSHGCPAVDLAISSSLINLIKGGCFFYIYF